MVATEVRCENILLTIDSPDSLVIEHWIQWIPGVAVLLKHSIPELAPLVHKHVTGGTKILLKTAAIQT